MPQPSTMTDSDEWDIQSSMKAFILAIEEKGMSVDDAFGQFDGDENGTLDGPELYRGLMDLTGDVLSPGQISAIIKAFDNNEDHRIDLEELRAAVEYHQTLEEE